MVSYFFSFLVLLTKLQRQKLKFNLFLNLQVYYMHVQLEFTLFWPFQVEFYQKRSHFHLLSNIIFF